MTRNQYTDNVFINCPFDQSYNELFYAMIFTIFDCGFRARCSREIEDSSQARISKIYKIIGDCKYGIHDISRTQLDKETKLPRFNMPLELGIFLGAKRFGTDEHKDKMCLILDIERYRYQTFISDIAGQDIKAHSNEPEEIIKILRNWLRQFSKRSDIPGGSHIWKRYRNFKSYLPKVCKELNIELEELTSNFNEYTNIVYGFLTGEKII